MAKNTRILKFNSGTEYDFRPSGICYTNNQLSAKTVDIKDFNLFSGATVLVRFYTGNRANNITLNVNNTGDISIKTDKYIFNPNIYYEFMYNGENWVLFSADKNKRCIHHSENNNNFPWHRIAYTDVITTSYVRRTAILIFNQAIFGGKYGELAIKVSTNNIDKNQTASYEAYWIVNKGFDDEDIKIGVNNTCGDTYFDVFYKLHGPWQNMLIESKIEGSDSNFYNGFTLCNSFEVLNTTADNKSTSVECYTSVEKAAEELHSKEYTAIISPNYTTGAIKEIKFNGVANSVNHALTVKNGTSEFTYNGSSPKTLDITDKNVEQTVTSGDAKYPLLLAGAEQSSSVTGKSYFDSGVTLNPATNILNGAKVYESLLQWGNTTIQNDMSPIDAAMLSEISNNKLAFMPADLINIEFSRDAGASWYTYPNSIADTQDSIPDEYTFISDNAKRSLVTDGFSNVLYLGARKDVQQKDDRLRITITGDGPNIYFKLKKILIYYCQANGKGNYCIVEGAYANDPETFIELGQHVIWGWTGWNSIPCVQTMGENTAGSRSNQLRHLRLTFGVTGIVENAVTSINVSKLRMLGTVSWGTLPSFAATGHLYTYDINQNARFPANLTSTGTLISKNGLNLNGNITINDGTNQNRYITWQYNNTNISGWRIGYLGEGSADANYLTFESTIDTENTWYKALRLDHHTLNANFGSAVLPLPTNINKNIGSTDNRWTNIYTTHANLVGDLTVGAGDTTIAIGSGSITLGSECTFNSNNVTISSSGLDLTKGDLVIGSGYLTLDSGNLTLNKGNIILSDENHNYLHGNAYISDTIDNKSIDNIIGTGVYRINGTLTEANNLPISNYGTKYCAELTVLPGYDNTIGQILSLLNCGGGDTNIYTRTKQNDVWRSWAKLQTNVEVGMITQTEMNNLIDNGIYSGVCIDSDTTPETFVLICINNYAAAAAVNPSAPIQSISHLKYSLCLSTDGGVTPGKIKIQKRGRDIEGNWDEWETIGSGSSSSELQAATSTVLGGIKTGFSRSGNKFPVSLNNTKAAYVEVGTAEPNSSGVIKSYSIRGEAINATYGSTTSNRYYGVEIDANGRAFVNVPWSCSGGSGGSSSTSSASYSVIEQEVDSDGNAIISNMPTDTIVKITGKLTGALGINNFAARTPGKVGVYCVQFVVDDDSNTGIMIQSDGHIIKWANGVLPFFSGNEIIEIVFTTTDDNVYLATWSKYY